MSDFEIGDIAERDIESWLESLPETPPTSNMLRWMTSYDVPCGRSCCYSPDCASIRCESCYISFTKDDGVHIERNVCMECKLIHTESLDKFVFEVVGKVFCDTCFSSEHVLHEHTKFCKIDKCGFHSLNVRSIGISPLKTLQQTDLPKISRTTFDRLKESGRNYCGGQCCEDFDSYENVDFFPVASPGCRFDHGMVDLSNKKLGTTDSQKFCCNSCAFKDVIANNTQLYVDFSQYCKICIHEKEMNEWRYEFKEAAKSLYDACSVGVESHDLDAVMIEALLSAKRDELKRLHLQPWIQKIIDEEFGV